MPNDLRTQAPVRARDNDHDNSESVIAVKASSDSINDTDSCYHRFMNDRTDGEPSLTREAVIAAACTLLQHGGIRAVTTRGVASAAGVPAPTIYRLFGDKDGLLGAMAEQAMTDYAGQEAARLVGETADPVEDLRRAWHTHIRFGLANPDLYGLLVLPSPVRDASATAVGIGVLTERLTRVAAAGLLRVPVRQAVRMIHAAGSGVVLTLIGDHPDTHDETLSDATLDAILASVLATQPAPRADDHHALVVTLAAALPDLPDLSAAEKLLLREWLQRITPERRVERRETTMST
ncbi:MAG: TetR/AcrR family transcriptional regulator [Lapillicoccus sp.]